MHAVAYSQVETHLPNWIHAQRNRPADVENDSDGLAIHFGRFCVLPGARILLCEGTPVEVGGRAFDLLVVLLEAQGAIVSKKRIFEYVWPSISVDEGNLRFQVAALRKVLGPDRDLIRTVTGRGYILSSDMIEFRAKSAAPTHSTAPMRPAVKTAPESLSHGELSVARGARPQTGGKPTIVVIEDDQDVRESLAGLLQSTGYRVESFDSIKRFLDNKSSFSPECLILDVWLPERSGLDFQEDFVKSNSGVPVIFISGHADVAMSVRAMKAGAMEFLTKPVRYQDLLTAVNGAIALKCA